MNKPKEKIYRQLEMKYLKITPKDKRVESELGETWLGLTPYYLHMPCTNWGDEKPKAHI